MMICYGFTLILQSEQLKSNDEVFAENLCNYNRNVLKIDPVYRTTKIPSFIKSALLKIDQKNDYIQYFPDNDEKRMIQLTFQRLPGMLRKGLNERMLYYFFIQDFSSNGMAMRVKNEDDEVYSVLIFNSHSLNQSTSEMLTEREKSNYKERVSDIDFNINVKTDFPAFEYVLLHEAAHVLDYSLNLSKFTNEANGVLLENNYLDFSHWKSLYQPIKDYDFPVRTYITFYGLRNGPYLDFDMAPAMLKHLEESIFPSMYAMQSSMEDFAELTALGLLCNNEKECYSNVRVNKNEYRFSIMTSPRVKKRLNELSRFLESGFEIKSEGFLHCSGKGLNK